MIIWQCKHEGPRQELRLLESSSQDNRCSHNFTVVSLGICQLTVYQTLLHHMKLQTSPMSTTRCQAGGQTPLGCATADPRSRSVHHLL